MSLSRISRIIPTRVRPTRISFGNKINGFQRASYATTRRNQQQQQRPARPFVIPPLPLALIGASFICLGLGLYEYLNSDIQKFPVPIRQALRKGLYYEQSGDNTLAHKYFKEALALGLLSEELESGPLIGIMIQLGALEEKMGLLPQARESLRSALVRLIGTEDVFEFDLSQLKTNLDQKKAVGIAQKLGDVTHAMKSFDEAEKWYVWSVEHLLKSSAKPKSSYGDSDEVLFDKEHMPDWLTKTDVGASLEALGSFYTARNKPALAIHLYLKALELNGMKSCQSAVLMNNLAESYSGLGQFEEAKIWGQRGLDLAQNPNTGKQNGDKELCDETCGVLLFNMGMLFEQTKDKVKAKQFYKSARQHGHDFKHAGCIKEADRALKRLEFEKVRDENSIM